MDYCLTQHHRGERPTSEEIMIKFNSEDRTITQYIEKDISKRYIILISKVEDFLLAKEVLKSIKLKYNEIRLALLVPLNIPNLDIEIKELKEVNIDIFTLNIPQSWTVFLSYIDRGFSDIYIGDELGFDLVNIYKIAKENNVRIRVIPSYAFSIWNNIPEVKKFFIRPEDIDIYSPYIDTLELLGAYGSNAAVEALLYRAYSIDKKWFGGSLDEIIVNLTLDLDSRYIHTDFATKRIKCQRQCLKGGKCSTCDKVLSLAETLKEQGLEIKQIKKKNKGDAVDGGERNSSESSNIREN